MAEAPCQKLLARAAGPFLVQSATADTVKIRKDGFGQHSIH